MVTKKIVLEENNTALELTRVDNAKRIDCLIVKKGKLRDTIVRFVLKDDSFDELKKFIKNE